MRTRTPHLPLIATALFACLSTLACQSAEPGQVSESTPAPEQAVAALSGTEAQDAASPRVETSAVATRIQDQELADDAATLQVKIQQRAVLSGRSIEQGDALLERADLEGEGPASRAADLCVAVFALLDHQPGASTAVGGVALGGQVGPQLREHRGLGGRGQSVRRGRRLSRLRRIGA